MAVLRTIIVCIIGILAISCATPNREGAGSLADRGSATASGLLAESIAATAAFDRFAGQSVITTVIELCETPRTNTGKKPSDEECRRLASDKRTRQSFGDLFAETAKIVALLKARSHAYQALGEVYQALKREASYNQKAELQAAVRSLADSAGKFVTAAGTLAGVGEPIGAAALDAAKSLATIAAGLWADADQTDRLEQANRTIAAALAALNAGIKAERAHQATVRAILALEPAYLDVHLMRVGILPVVPRLRAWSNAPNHIPDSAESTIRQSTGFMEGIVLAERMRAAAAFDAADMNYTILISGLDGLEKLHASFDAETPFDLTQFSLVESQIAVAINTWVDLRNKEREQAADKPKK